MMDFVLQAWVSGLIESEKLGWMLGKGKPWQPGEKLKLLFAGYNGTRNTGSDVRVEEMLRQIRHILGADRVEFSVMSQNFDFSRGYFQNTKQVHLPDVYPPFLAREVPKHHGVIACEGSTFKSKFANALTNMMIGSLGIAAAQNKLSVGYGSEAGHMDPMIAKMCARYCKNSLVITRNECRPNWAPIPRGPSSRCRSITEGRFWPVPAGMATRRLWWSVRLIRSGGR